MKPICYGIVAGGRVSSRQIARLKKKAEKIVWIAADSGAESLLQSRETPHILLGDLDSISKKALKQIEKAGKTEIFRFSSQKDVSDTYLALKAAELLICGGTENLFSEWSKERIPASFSELNRIFQAPADEKTSRCCTRCRSCKKCSRYYAAKKEEKEASALPRGAEAAISFEIVPKRSSWQEQSAATLLSGKAEVFLLGAEGDRTDHSLSNFWIAFDFLEHMEICFWTKKCIILPCAGEKEIVLKRRKKYPYLSILPLSEVLEGLSLEGFTYPLKNQKIEQHQASWLLSNQLTKETGKISLRRGKFLLIRSQD